MSKVIIFSHESDIDGLGCIVLGKLAFNEMDYVLMPNIEKLELTFRSYLENHKLDDYDMIYITDLALYDPSLTMVSKSSIKEKIFVFDHHKRALDDNMNRYPFTRIIEEDENGKRCGTDLFFEYLSQKNLLTPINSLKEFVEFTRLEDTWEWKKSGKLGEQAHDLAIFFNSVGVENYISSMTKKLSNNKENFSFSDEEKSIIQNRKNEYEDKLSNIMLNAEYFQDLNGNKYGVVYANYEYRNELAEYIIDKKNPYSIEYLIIVAMDKGEFGQKSYRSIDESFDVNEIAMNHGGGGHQGAASVNITKDQKEKSLILSKRESLKYLAESRYFSNTNLK